MKLKKVKIVVETIEKTNKRWSSALKGKVRKGSNEEVISVPSWEILGRIISPPRLQILTLIPVLKPKSISALAKALKKNFKNVYSDVKFLADLGLLDLKEEGGKKTLVPVAKFAEADQKPGAGSLQLFGWHMKRILSLLISSSTSKKLSSALILALPIALMLGSALSVPVFGTDLYEVLELPKGRASSTDEIKRLLQRELTHSSARLAP